MADDEYDIDLYGDANAEAGDGDAHENNARAYDGGAGSGGDGYEGDRRDDEGGRHGDEDHQHHQPQHTKQERRSESQPATAHGVKRKEGADNRLIDLVAERCRGRNFSVALYGRIFDEMRWQCACALTPALPVVGLLRPHSARPVSSSEHGLCPDV